MWRAYIIDRQYKRVFETKWLVSEAAAERALVNEYKRRGLDPADPNVFGSGIEDDDTEDAREDN